MVAFALQQVKANYRSGETHSHCKDIYPKWLFWPVKADPDYLAPKQFGMLGWVHLYLCLRPDFVSTWVISIACSCACACSCVGSENQVKEYLFEFFLKPYVPYDIERHRHRLACINFVRKRNKAWRLLANAQWNISAKSGNIYIFVF